MKLSLFLPVLGLALAVSAEEQAPFASSSSLKRPLKGRFLHLTDFHPDPHYRAGTKISDACHKKKGKGKLWEDHPPDVSPAEEDEEMLEKEGVAGKWGTPVSDCDSPLALVNLTMDWLKKEWADEVDFVVWTGDSARHDIDRDRPRQPKEIYALNQWMVDKMRETFPSHVHIVPSIGNNDIYPHNILAAGPSSVTAEFARIWKPFIPSDYRHVFERGLYFSVEVIPDQLAVISLNTLFWYDSNTLVDGCQDSSSDPGALHMDWLEVQLDEFRERGMQVWLSGHVPPHLGNYFNNCYLRYGDLALRYQDTIVGHLYGHMNIDHFFFLDVEELEASSTGKFVAANATAHQRAKTPYGIFGRSAGLSLRDELKKDFGEMPGPAAIKLKDYAVVNVGASVIPTYLPGVRVYSYNISGLDDLSIAKKRKHGHRHGDEGAKKDCSKPENQDKPHCVFKTKPRYYSKHSPSRSNQALSPLGYTQFYLPDIEKQKHVPEWKIEYSTHKPSQLVPGNATELSQPLPVPLHLLPEYEPEFLDDEEASGPEVLKRKKDKFEKAIQRITPWKMKDLTIGSYVKLSRKLVNSKKMWNQFQEFMFVSSTP